MKGYDEFVALFGEITVVEIGTLIMAGIFIYSAYKKFNDYIIKRHDIEEEKDRKLKIAYEGVLKYPEYRQQSLEIQHQYNDQFAEISQTLKDLFNRLVVMEEHDMRRERNQLREKLVQSYNYYTNVEKNPSQSWTNMEADAFWELYKDYRDAGGNGYVEETIKPAIEALTVIKVC